MYQQVMQQLQTHQVFVGCAAVSDYRVEQPEAQKIKKNSDQLVLTLVKNPDIISKVASSEFRPKLVVGFAAETENLHNNAQSKLEQKQLDLICANDVSQKMTGFGSDLNQILLLTKESQQLLELASKKQQAEKIVKKVASLLKL
jgi:phosphopantothenoylcysteine decarboxylase/phosphopantothenate--cysteine ligase